MEDYKKETIKHYNINASKFSQKFGSLTDTKRRSEFKKFIRLLKGKKILDLGCGSGDHALWFSKKGFDLTCVDLSDKMVGLCKRKGLNVLKMDLENLTFGEKTFDGIWAVASLIHIPRNKLKGVISKLHKILKDEGILYVAVKKGRGEGFINESNGRRFFVYWNKKELLSLFENDFNLLDFCEVSVGNSIFLQFFLKSK